MKTSVKFALMAVFGFAAGFAGIYLTRAHNSESSPTKAGGKPVEVEWSTLREADLSSADKLPESIKKVQGGNVRVPGFMIPLEDNQTLVSEFLLVPSPMACVHVPPPPPNQIILVRMASGQKAHMSFGPIWVQGKLRVAENSGAFGKSGYEIIGELTEPFQ